jgi:hypothetical protein
MVQYFNEFSKSRSGEEPLATAKDLPIIMRISMYNDNLTVHETANENEEYFNK